MKGPQTWECRPAAWLLVVLAALIVVGGCNPMQFNPEQAHLAHGQTAAKAIAGGDLERAESYYRKALASAEAAFGANDERVALAQNNLGMFYLNQKRYEDAQAPITGAISIYRQQAVPNQTALAKVYTANGQLALNRGDFEQAEASYLDALSAVSNSYDVGDDTRGRALMGMGHALRKQAVPELPNLYYWRALPYLEEVYGLRSPIAKELLHYLGVQPPTPLRLDPRKAARPGATVSCPSGLTMRRYPSDGGEVAQCETADGQIDAMVLSYRADNSLAVLSEQRLGVPHGLTTEWYANSAHMRQRGFWKQGKREGLVLEWHESGMLATAVEYRDGLKHGVQTDYDDDGRLLAQAHFADGIQSGPAMSFFPNGLRRAAGTFAAGKADGSWTYFGEAGEILGTVKYRKGVQVPSTRAK